MSNVINELIKAGTLKKEDVLDYANRFDDDSNAMHACATRMHTLLCQAKIHEPKPENMNYQHPNVCYWYAEEVLDSCWLEPTHKDWLQRSETQMTYLNMTDPADFLEFLNVASKIIGEMENLITRHPSAKGLFKQLLD